MRTDDDCVLCSIGSWPGGESVHAGTAEETREVSKGSRRIERRAELTRKETWERKERKPARRNVS